MSGTPRRDLGARDLPPVDSTPPTSEGGSGDSSKMNKQVEYLLATLEKQGVQIDDKIISIVDAEIAKIKAEASREASNESKRRGMTPWSVAATCLGLTLFTIASISVGFNMGVDWFVETFCEEYDRRTAFIFGEDGRRNGEDK